MLQTETNTQVMGNRILRAARIVFRGVVSSRGFSTTFEHGQWWLCHTNGAQWAVNDTNLKGVFDFEQVSRGDSE